MNDASPTPAPARVRIAPSPTGLMHVGTARTAIFDWLLARQTGGQLILRVEDTDRKRFVPGAMEDLVAALTWLGVTPDEGPGFGGGYGPYLQSDRLDLYRRHVDQLLATGEAYPCFCPPRPADAEGDPREGGQRAGYDRRCRNLAAADVAAHLAAGEPHVVRLKMPLSGEFVLRDHLRGAIRFDAAALEDTILLKSDGFPTYHLAVVVDDHLMRISHVLRGEEWIPSSPIQIQLYQAFGWPEPIWVHLPLVLNPPDPETGQGRGKLSKRYGATSLSAFRDQGYLPEAMRNFLTLLGWAYSGDQDLFTTDEALARFRLEDIKPSPAAWNQDKLDWMNGMYIRQLDPADLAGRILPFLGAAGIHTDVDALAPLVPLIQERIGRLDEAVAMLDFFWHEPPPPDLDALIPKKSDAAATAAMLSAAAAGLATLEDWSPPALEALLRATAEARGLKAGPAFQPIRVAVTGRAVAPPLFETLAALPRQTVLARLAAAADRLGRATEPVPGP